jgi:hypothetical protein
MLFSFFHHGSEARSDLKDLCGALIWPEGGMRNGLLYGGQYLIRKRILEEAIGTGSADFARSQITPAAWAAADGLDIAARWSGVVFRVSWVGLFPHGYAARVIRATAGDRMGVWVFGTSGKDLRSDIYVGHPGGNSGKPFETVFLNWGGVVALNVLHRPDRRLESYVFRLDEKRPVCRVVSGL